MMSILLKLVLSCVNYIVALADYNNMISKFESTIPFSLNITSGIISCKISVESILYVSYRNRNKHVTDFSGLYHYTFNTVHNM